MDITASNSATYLHALQIQASAEKSDPTQTSSTSRESELHSLKKTGTGPIQKYIIEVHDKYNKYALDPNLEDTDLLLKDHERRARLAKAQETS